MNSPIYRGSSPNADNDSVTKPTNYPILEFFRLLFEYQAKHVSVKLVFDRQSTRHFQTSCTCEFPILRGKALARQLSPFARHIEASTIPLFHSGRDSARTCRNSPDWGAAVGRLLETLVLRCERFEHQSKSGWQDGSATDHLPNPNRTEGDTPSANRVRPLWSSATTDRHIATQWNQQTALAITWFRAPICEESLRTCIDRPTRSQVTRGSYKARIQHGRHEDRNSDGDYRQDNRLAS